LRTAVGDEFEPDLGLTAFCFYRSGLRFILTDSAQDIIELMV
jgi:hypothetical protein